MSRVNSSGFWSRIGSAFERTDIDVAGSAWQEPGEDAVRPTTTRYAPIREAVDAACRASCARIWFRTLESASAEIFLLHYIEITHRQPGRRGAGQFLRSQPNHVHWVKSYTRPSGRAARERRAVPRPTCRLCAGSLAETDPL
jgi:hypothetical protein